MNEPLLNSSRSPTQQTAHRTHNAEGYGSVGKNNKYIPASSAGDDDDCNKENHKTTLFQTFVHLLKGYIGPGMLSLPWAVSQLGISIGFVSIFIMAFWSSYNCWTVVRLKRFIEYQRASRASVMEEDSQINDAAISECASSVTTKTSITYPDVGEWAYGKTFQRYVRVCICTQQLAICTVFVSFIGENLLAVLKEFTTTLNSPGGHVAVMTMALPFCLSLSFIPSISALSPAMVAGNIMLFISLTLLGLVVRDMWEDRPDVSPAFQPRVAPLALCAILYSFEGICLILPIEAAMDKPKYFKPVFVGAMGLVASIMATFSSAMVAAFGNVTNGSVTAYLVAKFNNNESVRWLLLLSNLCVSIMVLLTYPQQLFPAVELLGPSPLSRWLTGAPKSGKDDSDNDDEDDDKDLAGFDPLPPLPEHNTVVIDKCQELEHRYDDGEEREEANDGSNSTDLDVTRIDDQASVGSRLSSAISFGFTTKMVLPGDSLRLRAFLVLLTYSIAVIVPDVQALISLAGALAGSSSALLIPPMMDLALLSYLESDNPGATLVFGDDRTVAKMSHHSLKFQKIKCYVLIGAGLIFLAIGTGASLTDIISSYLGKG